MARPRQGIVVEIMVLSGLRCATGSGELADPNLVLAVARADQERTVATAVFCVCFELSKIS